MNSSVYRALQSERGRRGGLKAAESRRAAKTLRSRALDASWPRCPDCGTRTHLGLCPACSDR